MQPRISLVTLGVADMPRARHFYQDGLGWPVSSASTDEVTFFHTGGAVLALYLRNLLAADAELDPAGTGFAGFSLAHNVAEPGDVDAALVQAAAAGATILRPAAPAAWGGRTGYFADPDGHVWEIAWNPGFPFDADGSLRLPD